MKANLAPKDRTRSKISRRAFIVSGTAAAAGAGALVIAVRMHGPLHIAESTPAREDPFDAWIRIDRDNSAQLVLAQSEMGQGVYTALPMILAEEADLDWSRIQVIQSEFSRGTGGSGSVSSNFASLGRAGASVRALMIAAAARAWSVPEAECTTSRSEVLHSASGKRATYGELVATARRLPLPDPAQLHLKNPDQYTLLGRDTPHLDIPDKCKGATQFGLDVRLPGMVYAVLARCPTFGGTPSSFDGSKALATPAFFRSSRSPRADTASLPQAEWLSSPIPPGPPSKAVRRST